MVTSHTHPSLVASHIVNAIRNHLGFIGVDKIVNLDFFRAPSWPPPSPFVVILPN